MAGGKALAEKYELVGDVRGKGLMFCLELVSDRASKTPADKATMQAVFDGAYEAGVMVRVSGPNVILSPSLVITANDVRKILDGVEAGLKAATA